ncbi:hydroxycarboxylic acid receptor 2-like [Alosa alosa]|uniref:hydroxycarboxylic acid receptor 2-like n=1 Tax=Alosa alosa TaxID=278164 RepID=UPI0020153E00|nr:hydroxycarboxylic acid receptor 2-like [Alosa alosa]
MVWSVNVCCPYQGELLPRVLPPLIITEFLLGILGNGLALWVFCWHMRPWKSSTVLLFNLALADFLLIAVLPFRASYYLYGLDWRFSDAFCRVFLFLVSLNRNGSIAFLTLIALDRYMRVLHPHHSLNSASVLKAVAVAMAVWVLTVALNAHLLTAPQHLAVGQATQCESFVVCLAADPASMWYKSVFMASFFIPLGLILICSLCVISELRRRHLDRHGNMKQTLYSLAMVVVVFVVCFLPSNVAQILIWVRVWSKRTCDAVEVVNVVFYSTLTLTYLNSMLDPVVYYFSSPTFQQVCRRLVRLRSMEGMVDTGEDGTKDSSQGARQE